MLSFLYIILQFPKKAVTIGLYFKTHVCHGWQVVILSFRSNETCILLNQEHVDFPNFKILVECLQVQSSIV